MAMAMTHITFYLKQGMLLCIDVIVRQSLFNDAQAIPTILK